jgi:hypothetical protein
MKLICTHCGAQSEDNARLCATCGGTIPVPEPRLQKVIRLFRVLRDAWHSDRSSAERGTPGPVAGVTRQRPMDLYIHATFDDKSKGISQSLTLTEGLSADAFVTAILTAFPPRCPTVAPVSQVVILFEAEKHHQNETDDDYLFPQITAGWYCMRQVDGSWKELGLAFNERWNN